MKEELPKDIVDASEFGAKENNEKFTQAAG